MQLADQEGFKQRVTGGWWLDSSGDWKHSGPGVCGALKRYTALRNNLGWAGDTSASIGLFLLVSVVYI